MALKLIPALLCCLLFTNTFLPAYADDNDIGKSWVRKISREDGKHLYKQIYQALQHLQKAGKKISISLMNGKFIRGEIVRLDQFRLALRDYKKKMYVINYWQVKATSIGKIVEKQLKGKDKDKTLYLLGTICFHEKDLKSAKKYLKAMKSEYGPASKLLANVEEKIRLQKEQKESVLAEKEAEKLAEKEARLAEREKEKELSKAKKAAKFQKVMYIKEGGKEVDEKKLLVPGKYTVFEFYADW